MSAAAAVAVVGVKWQRRRLSGVGLVDDGVGGNVSLEDSV